MFSNIKRFGEGKHFLSRVNNFFFIVIEARFVEISKARVMAAERLLRFIYWQSLLPVFRQAECAVNQRIIRRQNDLKMSLDNFHFVDGTLQAGFHRAAVGIAVKIVLQNGELGGNH